MNPFQHIHLDYFNDCFENKPQGSLSTPEKLKLHITGDGTLSIKGKRYLRLGKITLFDPVKSKNITEKKYVGILDTATGEVLCFDINLVYKEYISKNKNFIHTHDNRKYEISLQTKDIVRNTIADDKQKHSLNCIDFA